MRANAKTSLRCHERQDSLLANLDISSGTVGLGPAQRISGSAWHAQTTYPSTA
jgi:hypothetical protein